MNHWNHQGSSHARGYGQAWRVLRARVLRRDQYLCQCAECKSSGRVRVAHEVDHIVSKAQGGTDALTNLQAINRECHRAKSLIEKGYTVKQQVGVDGWPLEKEPINA